MRLKDVVENLWLAEMIWIFLPWKTKCLGEN